MSVTTSKRKDAHFSLRTSTPVRASTEPTKPPPENELVQHVQNKARTSTLRPVRLLSATPSLVLAGLILLAWYVLTTPGHVSALFLPAPADVFSTLVSSLTSGVMLSNALVTIEESVLGFLLALAIALPLGYGLAKSRVLALTLHPYVAAGQAIPAIVIAPFFSLWLGYGLLPNILVCTLVVFFPIHREHHPGCAND